MKTLTLTENKNRFLQGLDFLCYGLEIFGFIGFELLLYLLMVLSLRYMVVTIGETIQIFRQLYTGYLHAAFGCSESGTLSEKLLKSQMLTFIRISRKTVL